MPTTIDPAYYTASARQNASEIHTDTFPKESSGLLCVLWGGVVFVILIWGACVFVADDGREGGGVLVRNHNGAKSISQLFNRDAMS